jgi:tetratricopeptide (TPR) repeat protein
MKRASDAGSDTAGRPKRPAAARPPTPPLRRSGPAARRGRAMRQEADRRWRIPPAILSETDETLEGSHILYELETEAGLQLWRVLRDVTLWATTDPEAREQLFNPGTAERRLTQLTQAALEPALEVPLITLASIPHDPVGTPPEVITLMCLRIAGWAEGRKAYGTAVAFAQAGALASPEDAAASYAVGRIALAWGRLPRAESWLRRTFGLARRTPDWQAYSCAYVDLGTLHAMRDSPSVARRHFIKGLRAARRHGLLHERARGLHGLFRLAMDAGQMEEAERLARAALRGYTRTHRETVPLLQDVARLHVARGRYPRAVSTLQKLLGIATDRPERGPALALLARAAALTGDARLYEDTWSEGWTLAQEDAPEAQVGALLDLARAAEARTDWLRVDQVLRTVSPAIRRQEDRRQADELTAAVAAARQRGA